MPQWTVPKANQPSVAQGLRFTFNLLLCLPWLSYYTLMCLVCEQACQ